MVPVTGFFTREIREKGQRTGFKIVTLDGSEGILAHVSIKSSVRVGKYGVNLEDLDRIAVPSMVPSRPDQLVVIDEIGKMECCSPLFRQTLVHTLDSSNRVIGSVGVTGGDFIQTIRSRNDVEVITVSDKNRDQLVDVLVNLI
jgi:nucleoside-triphosphatase